MSPGLGDLTGLPSALMFCGTRDLLQPGCDALFERADAADWPLEYVVAPGLIHVYPLLPIPEARGGLRAHRGVLHAGNVTFLRHSHSRRPRVVHTKRGRW